MGWSKPPPGPRGWSGHPKRPPPPPKKNERMRFGLWGWPDHPLGPEGGFGHPLPAVGGGFSHLHALRGGPATPKGQNPFFPFFFSLGLLGWPDHPLFLFISFFFFKKKKKTPKMPKTTPFCPKRHRFGRAQNGVVLE
jgi:hypothetical protein